MLIELFMDPALFMGLVLVGALILFITGAIPLPATAALTCTLLYVSGIIDSSTALKTFASDNVMIIAGLGIIGESAFRTGAAAKMGQALMKVAKTERAFVFWITMGAGIISGFLSNNGAAAVLIALTLGICSSTGMRRSKMMYPIIVGATFGGGITTVGSNSTLYLKETLENMGNGQTMSFFELGPICLILTLVSAIYLATIGFNLLPDQPRNEYNETGDMDFSHVPKWKTNLSMITLFGTVVAMYFESEIGISLGFVAIIGAIIVVSAGLITDKEATKAIPLSAIVLYSCMVPVSAAMENSGASAAFVSLTQDMLGNTQSGFMVMLIIFIFTIPLTNCMSNSATIIMLCPIVLAIAESLGMDPKASLIAVRLAGTIGIATPIAWPGCAMALEPGGYNFMDYVKAGAPLSLITALVSIAYIMIAYPLFG